MRKNLLFVMPSLSAGGGERSLINLLSHIDYEKYNVDLFLFSHRGLFYELLPQQVNVLPLPPHYVMFSNLLPVSIGSFIAEGKPVLALNRLLYAISNRSYQNVARSEQASWRYLAPSIDPIPETYDVAIGYLEKTSIYFCIDKVTAKKKIGWVHTDYDKMGMDPEYDRKYFQQLDHIVTVSDECANVLKVRFPEQTSKVQIIHNIVSPFLIREMASLEKHDIYNRKTDEIMILSIGRLHSDKNFELAISACKELVDRGFKVQWHIIGEGEDRDKLQKQINELEINHCFHLLGLKSNPYPYLQQADIYVQTSRFEGKSIAIDEAKILNKPIVITNFSTAQDHIADGIEGIIANMTPSEVAGAIGKIIENHQLRERFREHLSTMEFGTESEINKLYQLIG
ncbi:glycosyltransferase [Paenibacillus sp. PL2-23]|uniref:glycosyltransferase n=1 Tax=Paenibacillus sp. PL2-23 TaxID=2100729 RepID=UPI0030F5FB10